MFGVLVAAEESLTKATLGRVILRVQSMMAGRHPQTGSKEKYSALVRMCVCGCIGASVGKGTSEVTWLK